MFPSFFWSSASKFFAKEPIAVKCSCHQTETIHATYRLRQVCRQWQRDIECFAPLCITILPVIEQGRLAAALQRCQRIERLVLVIETKQDIAYLQCLLTSVQNREHCTVRLQYFMPEFFLDIHPHLVDFLRDFQATEYYLNGKAFIPLLKVYENTTTIDVKGNIDLHEIRLHDGTCRLKKVCLVQRPARRDLRTLVANFARREGARASLSMEFLQYAPRLEYLSILCTTLPFPAFTSKRLKHLELSRVLPGETIAQVLVQCPDIEHLKVNFSSPLPRLSTMLWCLVTLDLQSTSPNWQILCNASPNLRQLTLRSFSSFSLAPGEYCSIKQLMLDRCNASALDIARLVAALPNLQLLDASSCVKGFPSLESSCLQNLRIYKCPDFTSEKVAATCFACPSLHSLRYSWGSLQELQVQECPLRHLTLEFLGNLESIDGSWEELESVEIFQCPDFNLLPFVSCCIQLRSLCLNHRVEDIVVGRILSTCPNLHSLRIVNGKLIKPNLVSFSLTRLALEYCDTLLDESFAEVHCPNLQSLYLKKCPLLTCPMLSGCPKLARVKLEKCSSLQASEFLRQCREEARSLKRVYLDGIALRETCSFVLNPDLSYVW